MEKRKIGLFGGTFAPPHLGHVHALKIFREALSLDEILIMPTAIPPHKQKLSDDTPEQRLKMCESAFSSFGGVTVSDYEIKKGGVSYTVDTLRYLSSEDREIYLLCGSDMLLTLDKWYLAAEIFSLAKIVCVPRYSANREFLLSKSEEYTRKYSADVTVLEKEVLELSSTEIREKIKNGEDLTGFLPDGVIKIIKDEKLYCR